MPPFLKTILLSCFFSLPCLAQIEENKAFLLLKNDTIFQLNSCGDGSLNFIPVFKAPYLDSIGALSFCAADGYFYGLRFDNAQLVRFEANGRYENLGGVISTDSLPLPNEDLTSAIIHNGELFVLAYSTNSIYAIDLQKRPLTYRTVVKNIGFSIPNTLTYNPLSDRLYILNQAGAPIHIHPKTGSLELPPKNGGFANLPRKKLLSYGKLWFTASGRCFLLAGVEGSFYELDTEKRIAYYIANLGFNSPKDAVAWTGMPDVSFIQPELLGLRIQPYQHGGGFLELEWHEKNSSGGQVAYYYTERFDTKTMLWEEIAYIPGYEPTQQSNRYTTLDRAALAGRNCYRLRIQYNGGFLRYSQVVCYEYKKSDSAAELRLSLPIVDMHSTAVLLQALAFEGKKLDLRLCHLVNKKCYWQKMINICSADQSIEILMPEASGWYELQAIVDGKLHRLKLFKTSSY